MTYFTWRESGLTSECSSLEAMAARFEESASLMRRMADQGFRLERRGSEQRITIHRFLRPGDSSAKNPQSASSP